MKNTLIICASALLLAIGCIKGKNSNPVVKSGKYSHFNISIGGHTYNDSLVNDTTGRNGYLSCVVIPAHDWYSGNPLWRCNIYISSTDVHINPWYCDKYDTSTKTGTYFTGITDLGRPDTTTWTDITDVTDGMALYSCDDGKGTVIITKYTDSEVVGNFSFHVQSSLTASISLVTGNFDIFKQ